MAAVVFFLNCDTFIVLCSVCVFRSYFFVASFSGGSQPLTWPAFGSPSSKPASRKSGSNQAPANRYTKFSATANVLFWLSFLPPTDLKAQYVMIIIFRHCSYIIRFLFLCCPGTSTSFWRMLMRLLHSDALFSSHRCPAVPLIRRYQKQMDDYNAKLSTKRQGQCWRWIIGEWASDVTAFILVLLSLLCIVAFSVTYSFYAHVFVSSTNSTAPTASTSRSLN